MTCRWICIVCSWAFWSVISMSLSLLLPLPADEPPAPCARESASPAAAAFALPLGLAPFAFASAVAACLGGSACPAACSIDSVLGRRSEMNAPSIVKGKVQGAGMVAPNVHLEPRQRRLELLADVADE